MSRVSPKKRFGQHRLSAASRDGWLEWPVTQGKSTAEQNTRCLGPGEKGRVALAITTKRPVAIVLRFATDFHQAETCLGLYVQEQQVTVLQNPDFPKLAWGQLDQAAVGQLISAPLTMLNKSRRDRMALEEILVLPLRRNLLRPRWLGLIRLLLPFSKRVSMRVQLATFPYCYFNAYQYYSSYPDAACEMNRLNYANLAEYYCRKGRATGHEIPLCYDNPPTAGTLTEVLRWAARASRPRGDLSLLLRGFDTGPDLLAIQLENDRLRRQLDHLAAKTTCRSC
jgi:hypothetical protein